MRKNPVPVNTKSEEGKIFGKAVVKLSNMLLQRSARKSVDIISSVISQAQGKKLGIKYTKNKTATSAKWPAYFIGATSAKVLHSSERGVIIDGKPSRWVNAVLYLAPAEKAMTSFVSKFGFEMAEEVVRQGQLAAAKDDSWRLFAKWDKTLWEKWKSDYDKIISTPLTKNYKLPELGPGIGMLNVCPYASPNCRAVCLNRSGKGGWTKQETVLKMLSSVNKASKLEEGFTATEDLEYLGIKGYEGFYAGSDNIVAGGRARRTHAMWLIWAYQGPIQNVFNDILFYEIAEYAKEKSRIGSDVKLAIRLNGTSDIPAHTLRLHSATWEGKSLAGKNLMEVCGRLFGTVFYDYTKDATKMNRWIKARAWQGIVKALSGKVKMIGGFPSNYHMVFSWSEVHSQAALQVLKRGGNIVMVFRRSLQSITKGKNKDKYLYPSSSTAFSGVYLPDTIHFAQLSKDPQLRQMQATVLNGDETDLRFSDPYEVGNPDGGHVVGLVLKAVTGSQPLTYKEADRDQVFKHFANPIVLREIAGKVNAIVVENPPKERAVTSIDADLLNMAESEIDGFKISTTAMGT